MAKPTFLGIGVMKAGTTTLWEYLSMHPEVFVPPEKEINWLAPFEHVRKKVASQCEYEMLFPKAFKVRGEITPMYEHCLDEIKATYPGIKLILCVRHPIKQFISAVRHLRSDVPPNETKEFYNVDSILNDFNNGYVRWQIRSGWYHKTIAKVEMMGFPLHVINFDEIVTNQQKVWDDLADYLEVSRFESPYLHANSSEGREEVLLSDGQTRQLERIYANSVEYMYSRYGIIFHS